MHLRSPYFYMATLTRIELVVSDVTDRCFNRLNYRASYLMAACPGFEPGRLQINSLALYLISLQAI